MDGFLEILPGRGGQRLLKSRQEGVGVEPKKVFFGDHF